MHVFFLIIFHTNAVLINYYFKRTMIKNITENSHEEIIQIESVKDACTSPYKNDCSFYREFPQNFSLDEIEVNFLDNQISKN